MSRTISFRKCEGIPDEPDSYAWQLTSIAAPFRVIKPPELREAAGF